jgi:DNA polymerase III subunit chi
MTKVTFIHDADDRLREAASWLAASSKDAAGVAVFVPDQQQATQLDQLLWEQFPTGFSPHCAIEHPLSAETPVVFCSTQLSHWPRSIVLNLSDEVPQYLTEVAHVVEVVSQDEPSRIAGRVRFRHYQQAGMQIDTRKAGRDPSK